MCPRGGKAFCPPASRRKTGSAEREVAVSAFEATEGAMLWKRESGCDDDEGRGVGGRWRMGQRARVKRRYGGRKRRDPRPIVCALVDDAATTLICERCARTNEQSAEFFPREDPGVGWVRGRRKRVCVVVRRAMGEA
jgi:hypothetical protein